MMSHPIIRHAALEDAERIAALISSVAAKFILPEFSPEGRARFLSDHTAASMAQRMEAGYCYRVAEAEGELAGVVGVRDGSHLYHLFVAESFQGRGLGRRMWEQAKALCLAASNPDALAVNSSRNAVAVYEKFGFVASGPVQGVGGVLFVPMKLALTADNALERAVNENVPATAAHQPAARLERRASTSGSVDAHRHRPRRRSAMNRRR